MPRIKQTFTWKCLFSVTDLRDSRSRQDTLHRRRASSRCCRIPLHTSVGRWSRRGSSDRLDRRHPAPSDLLKVTQAQQGQSGNRRSATSPKTEKNIYGIKWNCDLYFFQTIDNHISEMHYASLRKYIEFIHGYKTWMTLLVWLWPYVYEHVNK